MQSSQRVRFLPGACLTISKHGHNSMGLSVLIRICMLYSIFAPGLPRAWPMLTTLDSLAKTLVPAADSTVLKLLNGAVCAVLCRAVLIPVALLRAPLTCTAAIPSASLTPYHPSVSLWVCVLALMVRLTSTISFSWSVQLTFGS